MPISVLAIIVAAVLAATQQPLAAATQDASTARGRAEATSPANEVRGSGDLLWLIDRDRRNLGVEYQQILKALDASKVPRVAEAQAIAMRFMFKNGGLLAEERATVVGLLRLGRDFRPLASNGDLVWVVRISHLWLGVTQELWIGTTSGDVHAMLPVVER